MKFLIFLSLTLSTSVFAKTFEEATEGWNCVYDVELGAQDKSIITGDFCIDGTYSVFEVQQATEGQMAVRARISDNGESITTNEEGDDYMIGTVTRRGCMQPGFSLNHCAIYSSPTFEIVVQGPIMMKEPGTWMSPVFFLNEERKALIPIMGKYPPNGIVNRTFIEVEDPVEVNRG